MRGTCQASVEEKLRKNASLIAHIGAHTPIISGRSFTSAGSRAQGIQRRECIEGRVKGKNVEAREREASALHSYFCILLPHYFSLTKSKTKIAHTPTVTGN